MGGGQFGDTALQCATRCGHVDLVDYLCTVGANVAVEGMRAKTALEWAAFLGQVRVLVLTSLAPSTSLCALLTPSSTCPHARSFQRGKLSQGFNKGERLAGSSVERETKHEHSPHSDDIAHRIAPAFPHTPNTALGLARVAR